MVLRGFRISGSNVPVLGPLDGKKWIVEMGCPLALESESDYDIKFASRLSFFVPNACGYCCCRTS